MLAPCASKTVPEAFSFLGLGGPSREDATSSERRRRYLYRRNDQRLSTDRKRRRRRIYKLCVILFIVFLWWQPGVQSWLSGPIVALVPHSVDRDLGDRVWNDLRRRLTVVEDPLVQREVNGLLARLETGVPEEDRAFKFTVFVVEDPHVNAFAVPGGTMVLHSSLILEAETPEEVAGVLAHEMAHVTHRHSMHQIVQTVGVITLLISMSDDNDYHRSIEELMYEVGAKLTLLCFSRQKEREADEVGFTYLQNARVDPRGLAAFFLRLEGEETTHGHEDGESLLSTHPMHLDRIEYLTEKWNADPDTSRIEPLAFDLEAVKARLRHHAARLQPAGDGGHFYADPPVGPAEPMPAPESQRN